MNQTVTEGGLEHRVLVLAPTGQDAANTSRILDHAGLPAFVCRGIEQLCSEIEAGAGAVLVTTEAFTADREGRMPQVLQRQPSWSDLPFVVLTRGGPDSPAGLQALATLGNAIALERPVRVSTLVAATRAALRQRTQQYKIREQLETLAQHDQRKDEFLAMLAHELRNPLAPIKHGVQMIQRGIADGERLHWITGVMDRQLSHLTRLVDDLLDVSRITRGKIHMEHKPLPVQGVVAAALETVRPLIESRRQQLTIEATADDYWVEGDHTRLTQVLTNLLNNAAKYTQEGGRIWLSLRRENGDVAIRVRDNGIGMASTVLPHVFDLFVQADSSLDRAQGGLGLGLTLVRRIVDMHRGSVRVASEGAGRGAEFTVLLPLLQSGTVDATAADGGGVVADCASSGCRVLVADDNVDLAQSIAMMLEYAGHRVHQVYSGSDAIAAAETFQPQVCLIDIGLPDLSGHEVARRLRRLPAAGEMLLIAVSGYAQDDQRRQAMAAGFDHYLVKPVDFDQLEALLPMQKSAA